jgi:phage repressor protein C with HTH and peptisase S24 domain
MNDKEKIEELLHHFRMEQKDFAEKCDFRPNVLSKIKIGEHNISKKIFSKIIAAFPEVNKDWLLTGEDPMLNTAKEITKNQITFSVSEFKQRGYAPYYSELQVSAGKYDLATIEQSQEPTSWIGFPNITVEAWFPIIGFSMEPKICAGDTIGVVKMDGWERIDPDKIYLIITREDRMIKYLVPDEADSEIIWAVSINRPRVKIFVEDIKCIYRIVWVGKLV